MSWSSHTKTDNVGLQCDRQTSSVHLFFFWFVSFLFVGEKRHAEKYHIAEMLNRDVVKQE